MKKILILLFSISIISCGEMEQNDNVIEKTEHHYGTIEKDDPKSLAAQRFTKAYENNNLASVADLFTEDAKIMINDTDLTFDQMVAGFSEGFKHYENIHHTDADTFTMHYDDGEVFTNYWYSWHGTNIKTQEELVVRGYAWFRWKDDKVFETYNAFDPTAYNAGMTE
ncbi:MAG: nuclear transport factor 2 family protein [Flavobacteriaceae bacterium]|nr:nuclear transport factor 2 family protein [Flavobacteriaceae bacterium]